MKNEKTVKKVATAAALGALTGAGMGILFAPKKGMDTRKDLKQGMNGIIKKSTPKELEETVNKKIDQLKKELNKLNFERDIKKVEKKATKIREEIDQLIDDVKEKGDDVIKKSISEFKDSAPQMIDIALNKLN